MPPAAPSPRYRLAWFPPTTGVNPYQDILYAHLAELGVELVPDAVFSFRWLWRSRGKVDFLHFHWRPDRYYDWPDDWDCWHPPAGLHGPLAWLKLAAFVGRLVLVRSLGYRLVWTIHEVLPKVAGARRLHRTAARSLARLSHVRLAHDQATVERARAELGRAASGIVVVPHGSYIGVYPPGRSRASVRAELGVPKDSFVFLAFGMLRPEKRLDLLLEAFAQLERNDVALLVAGESQGAAPADTVRAAAAADARISYLLGRVPEERVAELFAACDAAVFARSNGWTSGSLILALSLGLPAVAARAPAYLDLFGPGAKAGWLFEPNDPASLRAALSAAASDREVSRRKAAAAREVAASLRWSDTAAATLAAITGATTRQPWSTPPRASAVEV